MAKDNKPILYFVLGITVAIAIVGLIVMFKGGIGTGRGDYRPEITQEDLDSVRLSIAAQPPQYPTSSYVPPTNLPPDVQVGSTPTNPAPLVLTAQDLNAYGIQKAKNAVKAGKIYKDQNTGRLSIHTETTMTMEEMLAWLK